MRPLEWAELAEFWMAKYLVTVGQWRAFVRASGYNKTPPWRLKGVDNEPILGVSFPEAEIFTEWLDSTLRAWADCPVAVRALLDAGYRVRLPSEAEWERAARGTEFRHWPWGDTWDAERANTPELKLADASPVGCFPSGATPEGLQDMGGHSTESVRPADGNRLDLPDEAHFVRIRSASFAELPCKLRRNRGCYPHGTGGFRLSLSPNREASARHGQGLGLRASTTSLSINNGTSSPRPIKEGLMQAQARSTTPYRQWSPMDRENSLEIEAVHWRPAISPELRWPLSYRTPNGKQHLAYGNNISREGMFVSTDTPEPIGLVISMVIHFDSHGTCSVTAQVVSHRNAARTITQDPAGMGVKFLWFDQFSRGLLEAILQGEAG